MQAKERHTRLTRCRVNRGRNFTHGLDHRFARLEEQCLQVEIALNAAHDIVINHAAVAKVEDGFRFGVEHRRTNATILFATAVIDNSCLVRGGDGKVVVVVCDILGLGIVGLLFASRPPSRH